MNEIEPKFKKGDFAVNTGHNYICWLLVFQEGNLEIAESLMLTAPRYANNDLRYYWLREGIFRVEVLSELRKVSPTLELINKAKEYLDKMNSLSLGLFPSQLIDNLSYVELLYKLNEQEKELKRDDKV